MNTDAIQIRIDPRLEGDGDGPGRAQGDAVGEGDQTRRIAAGEHAVAGDGGKVDTLDPRGKGLTGAPAFEAHGRVVDVARDVSDFVDRGVGRKDFEEVSKASPFGFRLQGIVHVSANS